MRAAVLALTFVCSAVTGCATSTKTYGPDGREVHALNCSGLARSWNMCMEKAGEICGARGYDVINRTGDTGVFAQGTATRYNAQASGGSVITRGMMVACK